MSKHKVLAVDDTPENLAVLKVLFDTNFPSMELLTADSAREGLAIAAETDLCGALVDLQMPGMDGLEMTRRLKADPKTANTHVVLITAHAAPPELKAEGMNAGANDFITKPVENIELVAKIRVMARLKSTHDRLRDINEHLESLVEKRTEDLRASHSLLKNVFNSAEAMAVVSKDGTLVRVNDGMTRLLNRPEDDLIGRKCSDLFGIEMCQTAECPLRSGECPGVQEVKIAVEGQDPCVCLMSHSQFLDNPGSGDYALILTLRDITEYREIERQLRHVQKMEAIGQLAGGVAHDFNNALSVILGHGELLVGKLSEETTEAECAATIVRAAKRASSLTEQLLGFARRGKEREATIDANEVISEVCEFLHRTVDRLIEIDQHFSEDPVYMIGDPGQIQQAVMNLAMNACDAMEGGGRLTFRTELVSNGELSENARDSNKDAQVRIVVADTGTGIPEQIRDHIFEPFFTTREQGKGTGLGLAMVHGIVKNHGGRIDYRTEVGHGTEFELIFDAVKAPPETPEQIASVQPGTGNVLIIDDEKMVAGIAADVVESLGYTPHITYSALEAIKYFSDHHNEIDLVITDMMMPKMNGAECFRRLKTIEPGVRAILISGYGVGRAEEALREGVKEFIRKPFTVSSLSSAISRALECQPVG